MIKIKIFPAMNGDCIMIDINEKQIILIDGGYVDTYKTYLKPELRRLLQQGRNIDLTVITHIDADHISGIIKMLDDDEFIIPINNIWHNSYRHIQNTIKEKIEKDNFFHHDISKEANVDYIKKISAKQGSTLAALIQRKGINWNAQFNSNAVTRNSNIKIENTKIAILTPTTENLDELKKYWEKELIKNGLLGKEHSEEYWDDAFDFFLSKDLPGFRFHTHNVSGSEDLEDIKKHIYTPDTSSTNGSSISFVMTVEEAKILMMGDAHAEDIIAGLHEYYGKQKEPYYFDAIKLSHHGSFDNNSPELLDLIDSDKWIISTNGDVYNHPDLETLAHIITKGHDTKRRLIFNYDKPICKLLDTENLHSRYSFDVVVPEDVNKPSIISI